MDIVLASSNQGKLKEFAELFRGLPYKILPQKQFGISDAEETGLTFIENALIKARHASVSTGLPTIADDSGLVIDALHGAPGIYSARYAGPQRNMQDNIDKILMELKGLPFAERRARFVCCLVYLRSATDALPLIAQASWEGYITEECKGLEGFCYDPIFFLPDLQCTVAELEPEVKNQLSHRGQALRKLRELMNDKMYEAHYC